MPTASGFMKKKEHLRFPNVFLSKSGLPNETLLQGLLRYDIEQWIVVSLKLWAQIESLLHEVANFGRT